MTLKTILKVSAAAAAFASLGLAAGAQEQEQEQAEATRQLDTIVTVGTRVANRTALDTAAPVDVVSAEAIQNIGIGELNQALSVQLPSYNFPRPALADGTDSIRPAALRGLAPSQTLVLVNGKRRHTSALVNVNGTFGRGSSAVDLNTIPTFAVGGVEVLRDGASALYGSDAIAGVVNVRLREANTGGGVQASYGWRETEYTVPVNAPTPGLGIPDPGSSISRKRSDGHVFTVSGWRGFALGDDGFLTLSGEFKDQNNTERSGFDTRQQYPGSFPQGEAIINRFNAWTGEPKLEQISFFANAGYSLNNGAELYGWGSFQERETVSAGFFRRPLDDRNVIEIYPNGFLPKLNPFTTDYSALGGVRFTARDWDYDFSLGYGSNKVEFTIIDTLNRSIGPSSKTVFDAGGYEHAQLVFNLAAVRGIPMARLASDLNVAWGIEARRETYEIFAGEPDSFRNGGVLLNGNPTASGSQVFPGFRPENERDESRSAIGAYVDLEANLTDALLVSGAIRGESYSDFGQTLTGKLAARYDFNDNFAIRGSVQNGFRAPSLQQQFFTTTSTNFIGGIPFDITTFTVDDPVAIALGSTPLQAEESINYALGAVFRTGDFSLTVDAYRIDIDDRIVLSENLNQPNVRAFLQAQGFIGSGGGRFFLNGVDTETQGVDVIATYTFPETEIGRFDATFGANYNETKVTAIPAIPQLTQLNPPPVLFNRVNILSFEKGAPKDKFTGQVNWNNGPFGATLRAIRYGEVLVPQTNAALDYTQSPKTVLDLEGRFTLADRLTVALGADNILDEYPDAAPGGLNSTGNTPFSTFSPFGYSGRFVYTKVTLNF